MRRAKSFSAVADGSFWANPVSTFRSLRSSVKRSVSRTFVKIMKTRILKEKIPNVFDLFHVNLKANDDSSQFLTNFQIRISFSSADEMKSLDDELFGQAKTRVEEESFWDEISKKRVLWSIELAPCEPFNSTFLLRRADSTTFVGEMKQFHWVVLLFNMQRR